MINEVSEKFSKEIIRFMALLAKVGMAFYSFDEGYFLINNTNFYFDEDLDFIIAYLLDHYKTKKSLYKVTYLEDFDGGIAVGYQKAKELAEGIKINEFSREEYNKQRRKFDLLNEREKLGVMKWANSSDTTIRQQEEWIQHLEEELKNFDKNLELTLKEYTKIEKINKI